MKIGLGSVWHPPSLPAGWLHAQPNVLHILRESIVRPCGRRSAVVAAGGSDKPTKRLICMGRPWRQRIEKHARAARHAGRRRRRLTRNLFRIRIYRAGGGGK